MYLKEQRMVGLLCDYTVSSLSYYRNFTIRVTEFVKECTTPTGTAIYPYLRCTHAQGQGSAGI